MITEPDTAPEIAPAIITGPEIASSVNTEPKIAPAVDTNEIDRDPEEVGDGRSNVIKVLDIGHLADTQRNDIILPQIGFILIIYSHPGTSQMRELTFSPLLCRVALDLLNLRDLRNYRV